MKTNAVFREKDHPITKGSPFKIVLLRLARIEEEVKSIKFSLQEIEKALVFIAGKNG